MATLKDLSAHLGLSITQVSRALNGYSDVSEETRKRVQEAAQELSYQPNLSARKLARGRSGMIGLVRRHFPEITKDQMFLDVVTGLSLEFAKRDMQLVLHVAPRENDIVELHRKLYAGGAIDGFVLLEPFINDPRVEYLKSANIPFVMHGRTEDAPDYPYFDIDNEAVGYQLTKHLTDLGHKKIMLLNGFEDRGYNVHREQGYRRALDEAGLKFDPRLVRNARMNEDFGSDTVNLYFTGQDFPTAVIAGHVRIASGLMNELQANGFRVPEDVSVVSHDDELMDMPSNLFEPPLTVSRANIRDSWVPLGDFMERAVQGEPAENLQQIHNIELIVRHSTAPRRDFPAE